jgi:hypothetical protein
MITASNNNAVEGGRIMWYDPERWPEWLRWIVLLPAAFIAALVFGLINNIFNAIMPYAPEVVMRAFVSAGQAVAFVLLGAYIAPRWRTVVAVLLAFVPIIWAAVVFVGSLMTNPWSWAGIVYACCYLGGAIYGIYGVAHSFHDAPHRDSKS